MTRDSLDWKIRLKTWGNYATHGRTASAIPFIIDSANSYGIFIGNFFKSCRAYILLKVQQRSYSRPKQKHVSSTKRQMFLIVAKRQETYVGRGCRAPGPPHKPFLVANINFSFQIAQVLLENQEKKFVLVPPRGPHIRSGPRTPKSLIRAWSLIRWIWLLCCQTSYHIIRQFIFELLCK